MSDDSLLALFADRTQTWTSRYSRRVVEIIFGFLRTGDRAVTIDRLLESRHVRDLRFIVAVASLFVVAAALWDLSVVLNSTIVEDQGHSIKIVNSTIAQINLFFIVLAPVIGGYGVLVAWMYRVGSARLGVVDLFACEISTLCRITAVMGAVDQYRQMIHKKPTDGAASGAKSPAAFSSQEEYFPVFVATIKDLQSLEARVVIKITDFYTYMKAVRDIRRRLPIIPEAFYSDTIENLVYTLYLGLESARHAICDLIEVEAELAERLEVILISELSAYKLLLEIIKDKQSPRYKRIELRRSEYIELCGRLWTRVRNEFARESDQKRKALQQSYPDGETSGHLTSLWALAAELIRDLEKRYYEAIGSNVVGTAG